MPYFITRDRSLLARAQEIEEKWQLRILDPASLIADIDELRRADAYQPVRFAGADITQRLLTQSDLSSLSEAFCNQASGEGKRHFRAYVNQFVALPAKYCSLLVFSGDVPIGFLVSDITPTPGSVLSVHAIRVAQGDLAQTLAAQLVRYLLVTGLERKTEITAIEDPYLQPEVVDSLSQAGFFETTAGWAKVGFRGALSSSKVADKVCSCGEWLVDEAEGLEEWASLLREDGYLDDPATASEQEHYLWPAKITDANLPTYIVPVRASWAKELFEERLARQNLYGRRLDLAFRTEAVYYRSRRGPSVMAPARLLWYVSKGFGGKSIRACSRLDAVDIGSPKDLYRKYRRLGIYEWPEVFDTAHNDLEEQIMVLRFSDTELLPNPISWERLQELFRRAGIRTQVQQPVVIPRNVFVNLYDAGIKA